MFVAIGICLPVLLGALMATLVGRQVYRKVRRARESGKEWIMPFYGHFASAIIVAVALSYTLTSVFVDLFGRPAEEGNLAQAMFYFQLQLLLVSVPIGAAIVIAFYKGLRA